MSVFSASRFERGEIKTKSVSIQDRRERKLILTSDGCYLIFINLFFSGYLPTLTLTGRHDFIKSCQIFISLSELHHERTERQTDRYNIATISPCEVLKYLIFVL